MPEPPHTASGSPTTEKAVAERTRADLRTFWAEMAELDDQNALARLKDVPVEELADLLLADAEANCRRVNLLIVRMEEAKRDPTSLIDLLELMTRASAAIRAFRSDLEPCPRFAGFPSAPRGRDLSPFPHYRSNRSGAPAILGSRRSERVTE